MLKKQVLILSKKSAETCTEIVMDWVCYLGGDSFRINGEIFESGLFSIDSFNSKYLDIESKKIPIRLHSVWLRRWSDFGSIDELQNLCIKNKIDYKVTFELCRIMMQDSIALRNLITNTLRFKRYLTSPHQTSVNKLDTLIVAQKRKIKVPKFILTTSKKHVVSFFKKSPTGIVIKDITSGFHHSKKPNFYSSYTEFITHEEIVGFPENFPLSYFQQYIPKKFEIRAFVLHKKIFSMAIFSQLDQQTKIDYRKYNHENPNRTVPYRLPNLIEKKLLKLMRDLRLDTGSIDLIKGLDNSYYFLEVNPIGHFGNVSYWCNYNLEYQIAKFLLK